MTYSVVRRTLVVHGAKGGVGASLLATQLAVDAAGRARTALVDLDVTGGTSSALLGLEERGSVLSLLRPQGSVGSAEVSAVARRHPSGLAVLAAEPFDPASALLDGGAVRELLRLARSCFDVVVVDVPARLDERGVAAMAAADAALLVVTPEVPCVMTARRLVDALAWRRFPLGHMGVVVNMLEEATRVTPEQVAAALTLRLTGSLPFHPEPVRRAINSTRDHVTPLTPATLHTAITAISTRVLPTGEPKPAAWSAPAPGAATGDATGDTARGSAPGTPRPPGDPPAADDPPPDGPGTPEHGPSDLGRSGESTGPDARSDGGGNRETTGHEVEALDATAPMTPTTFHTASLTERLPAGDQGSARWRDPAVDATAGRFATDGPGATRNGARRPDAGANTSGHPGAGAHPSDLSMSEHRTDDPGRSGESTGPDAWNARAAGNADAEGNAAGRFSLPEPEAAGLGSGALGGWERRGGAQGTGYTRPAGARGELGVGTDGTRQYDGDRPHGGGAGRIENRAQGARGAS